MYRGFQHRNRRRICALGGPEQLKDAGRESEKRQMVVSSYTVENIHKGTTRYASIDFYGEG